jgi:PAS domain S-box-containing protein
MAPSATPSAPFLPEGLLLDLLAISLAGVKVLRPVYSPTAELVDFAITYLSPTGQRMLGLAERPGGTLLTRFPHAVAAGILVYYQRVYEAGASDLYEVNYQADGLDNYLRLAARRSGDWLVVSFTDTSNQPRSAVETTLRESQAREHAAHREAETQRLRLHQVLMKVPASLALLSGPDHAYELVNPTYAQLLPPGLALGASPREAIPRIAKSDFFELLDRVCATGEPFYEEETEAWGSPQAVGQPEPRYYRTALQPIRNAQGEVADVLHFAVDITAQVAARRQVEQLNHELEARVRERTGQLAAALHAAERQRAELTTLFEQAPVSIAILDGPDYVVRLANQNLLDLWDAPAAQVLNQPFFEAMPEARGLGFEELLTQVVQTGEPRRLAEVPAHLTRHGERAPAYANVTYQPWRNPQGEVTGVLVVVVEVTEQVLARQRAATLQAELLAAAQHQAAERLAFYHIFEQTPALVALLRAPGHTFEYVNPAYQAVFSGRPLLGQEAAAAVPELQAQGFVALMDHVYQSGETYFGQEARFVLRPAPGQPLRTNYHNFTYQAYRENGQVAGITVFAYDVTEQVLARQERETERQRLLRLFEEAPAGICILAGPSLVYEFANRGYQELLPGRAFLGRPIFEAMPELLGTPVAEILRRVYATGHTHEEQALLIPVTRTADGVLEERYFTFVCQSQRDEHGQVTGVLTFVFEVTAQVQAQQAAEASTRQLRLITDTLPVLIGYVDRDERYRFANRAYQPWFNLSPAELLGQSVREVVGTPAYASIQPHIQRALAGETVNFETEMPFRPGFTKHIRTSYIPDVRHDAVQGFYSLVTDVSEQAEARQQVEALNQRLAAINQELEAMNEKLTTSNQDLHETNRQLTRTNVDLDNFIYTASHDLKQPISNIEGLLLALEHELPAASRVGDVPLMLTMMQGAVERFTRTIAHLTDLSSLQKEHAQPSQLVALAAVVDEVRLDLLPLLHETQAQLTVEIPASITLIFSAKNLRSVVYNLLSNALKYRQPDRPLRVQLRYQSQPDYQVFEVQDNGLGLDLSQDYDKLFAMFQRLHTHVEGTGIGLYMVKKMVENAGGYLEVESQFGQGTTFRVYFPR